MSTVRVCFLLMYNTFIQLKSIFKNSIYNHYIFKLSKLKYNINFLLKKNSLIIIRRIEAKNLIFFSFSSLFISKRKKIKYNYKRLSVYIS